jgi:sec-independent protein translocase protein TatB
MFDISWSELLILGIVTLIFVGPKEMPRFLGTLGKYAGMVRRQAQEFRQQFDDAMREAELQRIKDEVEGMSRDIEKSVREADQFAKGSVEAAKSEMRALGDVSAKPKFPPTEVLEEPAPGGAQSASAEKPEAKV